MAEAQTTPPPANLPGDLPPGLSKPAQRALAGAGYTHLAQLTTVRAADLLQLHGFGPKGITVLRAALHAQGLAFAGEEAGAEAG